VDAPEFELISRELYTETQSVLVDIFADPTLASRLVVGYLKEHMLIAI
jgi:hypothetical protein